MIRLFLFLGIFIICAIVITQIIIPGVKGRKIFPIFRRQLDLEYTLREAKQTKHEQDLLQQIKDEVDEFIQ